MSITSAVCCPRTCLGAGALATLLAATAAQAHVFCATSSSQLQAALTAASDGGMYNGEDNQIELAAGTYKTGAATGNGPFHFNSTAATGKIVLLGGFNATCNDPRPNAARAKLDGNSLTPVLSISNAHASIEVTELTVQNGESTSNGGGVLLTGGAGIALTFAIIQNNHTTRLGGGFGIHAGGAAPADYVSFETNLVINNSADQDFGAGFISSDAANVAVTHDTIYGNTTSATGDSTGTGGLFVSAQNGYLDNNIFRSNTLYGFYLEDIDVFVTAKWNAYGSSGGKPPASGSTGNTTQVPNFIDAAGGDFHLSGTSPLLAYSPEALGYYQDIEGHYFAVGGMKDIGVYAETVFSDGFDGN